GVDVVGDQVGDRRVAQVLDHVVEEQPPLAEPRPDLARQPHVLAVDARLADAPLYPHHVVVAVPVAVHVDVPGGQVRRAAVQRLLLALVDRDPAGGCKPARDEQPTVEPAQPALALGLVEGGVDLAGRRAPAERGALVVGEAEVHTAAGQHREREATARAHLDRLDPRLGSLRVEHRPGAAELADVADPLEQLRAGPVATVETWHANTSVALRHCGVHADAAEPRLALTPLAASAGGSRRPGGPGVCTVGRRRYPCRKRPAGGRRPTARRGYRSRRHTPPRGARRPRRGSWADGGRVTRPPAPRRRRRTRREPRRPGRRRVRAERPGRAAGRGRRAATGS